MRRSSTSRSIGNHASGAPHPTYLEKGNQGVSYFDSVPANSVISDGEADPFGDETPLEKERRKSIADSHVEKYVAEQLTRIMTDESAAVYEDEFEAQID
jgi:hypothetical protein